MARPIYRQRWAWAAGIHHTQQENIPSISRADIALSSLADDGLLTTRQLADFQNATGLADMAWRIYWNQTALEQARGELRTLLRRTHGFVIFMHGWSSDAAFWGPLPALVCAANSHLVALVPDLNGFGHTPFLAEVPSLELCTPAAVMQAVIHWTRLLGLRSGPRARRRRRVITFVGHSSGGAASFYFDPSNWHPFEFAHCAIAPTLLLTDELRRAFYHALGANDWIKAPPDERKARLDLSVVERLMQGVSKPARDAHLHTFTATPPGTRAQTFAAIGAAPSPPSLRPWTNFRVILGHDDSLLNVSRMLGLLDDLGFASHQVQVVPGDHYLLSVGTRRRRLHLRNRETILGHILYLHEACREQQHTALL